MTSIEWTEQTWNPITGCSRVSEGCKNCYAEVMTRRLQAMGQPKYQGLLNEHGRFNGKVRFDETALLAPLKRKKPTTYFVNSMSDLFHENVADEWIDKIFAVMALAPQHTFQVLTKRAERMREYLNWMSANKYFERRDEIAQSAFDLNEALGLNEHGEYLFSDNECLIQPDRWPLSNVHLGVSTENQEQADARIPHLLETPAAVRFVSAEPLLGPIRFQDVPGFNRIGLDLRNWWIVVGGESGPNARPCNIDWIRSVVQQCKAANVPVFVKQMSAEWAKSNKCDKGDIERFPVDLQLREFPLGGQISAKDHRSRRRRTRNE